MSRVESSVPEPRRPAYVYAGHALARPLSVAFLVLGSVEAVVTGSMIVGASTMLAGIVIALVAPRSRRFCQTVDEECDRAERERRDRARAQRMLVSSPEHRETLTELVALTADIERRDPALAMRLDLTELLDDYADRAIAFSRYDFVARCANIGALRELLEELDEPEDEPELDRARLLRRAILQRRVDHARECQMRARAAKAQTTAIAELIRLAAQRSSVRALDEDAEAPGLRQRLDDMDETAAALRELRAA